MKGLKMPPRPQEDFIDYDDMFVDVCDMSVATESYVIGSAGPEVSGTQTSSQTVGRVNGNLPVGV